MRPSQKQQYRDELCATTIRALTGYKDIVHQGNALFHRGRRVMASAPHLQPNLRQNNVRACRGISDGVALRLKYSDASLHKSLTPKTELARLIFNLLEQLRVESLVASYHPGIKSNLHYQFRRWSTHFCQQHHTETQAGLLIYTLAQMVWSRLNAQSTLEESDDIIESTRDALAPRIGAELVQLKRTRQHQPAYARHALNIGKIIDDLTEIEYEESSRSAILTELEDTDTRIALALDFSDDSEHTNIATIVTGDSQLLAASSSAYKVYTRAYDREINASAAIRKDELRELRDQLDQSVRAQGINVPRLARQITALLATPQRDGWLFGEDEGVIDGRRLAQVVSTPTERRIFRKDQQHYQNDCLLGILIDCSGSMKKYNQSIAVLIDSLARALDQAGIASEILGFTTNSWNGGRAQRDWLAQGKPKNPGRLNEQCHLIYKNADTRWRKARKQIAALLKTNKFREGIDAEALQWACKRMQSRQEQRKILLVISDGNPMDSSTSMANDAYYLDHHLRQVIAQQIAARQQLKANIEIFGIGVGLDLSPYYQHSCAIDLSESLSNHVFQQILRMIARSVRR